MATPTDDRPNEMKIQSNMPQEGHRSYLSQPSQPTHRERKFWLLVANCVAISLQIDSLAN